MTYERLKEKIKINGMNLYIYERSVYQNRAIEIMFSDLDVKKDITIPKEIAERNLKSYQMFVEVISQSLEFNLQTLPWYRYSKKKKVKYLIENLGDVLSDADTLDIYNKIMVLENGKREFIENQKNKKKVM